MKLLLVYFFVLLFVLKSHAQDSIISKISVINNLHSESRDSSFPRINTHKNRYYFVETNGIKSDKPKSFHIALNTINNYSLLKNIPELKTRIEITKRNIKRQEKFGIAGIPCFAVGLGVLAMSFMTSTAIGPNGNDHYAAIGASIGGIIFTTGLSFEIVSIVNRAKKKKHLSEVINIYNSNI